jgi:hypothetical protein
MSASTPEFIEWQKIPRLKRGCVITEKIDGTNGQLLVQPFSTEQTPLATFDGMALYAGSRSRWLTLEADNFGFARWASENAEPLIKQLGVGRHYGEWWGSGIQRRYGREGKHFSLFNWKRWEAGFPADQGLPVCSVVPLLYAGEFTTNAVDDALARLRTEGSLAAPGFKNPEGIVVFMPASNHLYKVTLDNDAQPKSVAV